jgi:hypothetical protein
MCRPKSSLEYFSAINTDCVPLNVVGRAIDSQLIGFKTPYRRITECSHALYGHWTLWQYVVGRRTRRSHCPTASNMHLTTSPGGSVSHQQQHNLGEAAQLRLEAPALPPSAFLSQRQSARFVVRDAPRPLCSVQRVRTGVS